MTAPTDLTWEEMHAAAFGTIDDQEPEPAPLPGPPDVTDADLEELHYACDENAAY